MASTSKVALLSLPSFPGHCVYPSSVKRNRVETSEADHTHAIARWFSRLGIYRSCRRQFSESKKACRATQPEDISVQAGRGDLFHGRRAHCWQGGPLHPLRCSTTSRPVHSLLVAPKTWTQQRPSGARTCTLRHAAHRMPCLSEQCQAQ